MGAPTPAEMAAWPLPNYVNPETRKTALFVCIGIGIGFALPLVLSRIFIRLRMKGKLGADDWVIVAAMIQILSIGSNALAVYGTHFGGGYHLWDVKPQWVPIFRKIAMAGAILFNTLVVLPKISVCLTYLRLFPSRLNRYFCIILIVFMIGLCLSTDLVTIFQCRPVKSYWDATVTAEYCVDPPAFNLTTGSLNSFTDLLSYLWPIQFLLRVQIPLRQRLGICLLFALGCSVTVAGLVRLYYVHKTLAGWEYFYDGAAIWASSSIEANFGIVFACLHAIKPLMKGLTGALFNVYGSGRPSRRQYNNRPSGQDEKDIPMTFGSGSDRPTHKAANGASGVWTGTDATKSAVTRASVNYSSPDLTIPPKATVAPRDLNGNGVVADPPEHGIRYTQRVVVKSTSAESALRRPSADSETWIFGKPGSPHVV
ncbi:hypothetical protein EJ06DRAFT_523486 [Trichodelitschia bisporula]|uniref:Rhodopsin domain-containing protein n=1 Tax=Trichodelitschia bisporula TaxID=703511 RepID=A0A6G1HQ63_9PEZI|nr:hypothetical protein EJ06DRAFT_523486 [Trichodelitschia bisporula]